MVITMFAAHSRADADKAEDYRVAFGREMLESLTRVPGFISYNIYACLDDRTAWMGVVRWENRQSMLAWRDDPHHRSVFHRITEFYTDFNIQHSEVYREMFFSDGQRQEPDPHAFYRAQSVNIESPPSFEEIYGEPMPGAAASR